METIDTAGPRTSDRRSRAGRGRALYAATRSADAGAPRSPLFRLQGKTNRVMKEESSAIIFAPTLGDSLTIRISFRYTQRLIADRCGSFSGRERLCSRKFWRRERYLRQRCLRSNGG